MQTRIFANILSLWGVLVAIFTVGGAYLVKIYWTEEYWVSEDIDWGLIKFHMNSGLLLGFLLLAVALALKRSRTKWVQISLLAAGGTLVFLSGLLIINGGLLVAAGFNQLHARESSKYTFHSDWVTRNADNWSKHLAEFKARPGIRALEIGSFEGRSALWFLENILTDATSAITCIDLFLQPFEQVFDQNVELSGLKNKVIKLKGYSNDVLRKLPANTYDFVYIDGSHIAKDVLMDAVLVWDLLKPRGIIIFDDYRWMGVPAGSLGPAWLPGTAVDAFLEVYEPYIDVLHNGYQLVVRKKEKEDLESQKFGLARRIWNILYW